MSSYAGQAGSSRSERSYPAVFVMRANGTRVRQVSRGGYNVAPDWGPPADQSLQGRTTIYI